jgi:hypothetical protein
MTNVVPGRQPTGRDSDAEDTSVAYGSELNSEDVRLRTAVDALSREKSLTRVNANARATVSTVAFVGTALTALGLVSASSLLTNSVTRWLAIAAAALALLAVVASITFLAVRLEWLNIDDLTQVDRWYNREFRRSYLAVVGSRLLLAAVICGGVAAGSALWAQTHNQSVAVTMQVLGSGDDRSLTVGGSISGVEDGTIISTTVVALAANGCPESVLVSAKSRVGRTGVVSLNSTVKVAKCSSSFRFDVAQNGAHLESLTFP